MKQYFYLRLFFISTVLLIFGTVNAQKDTIITMDNELLLGTLNSIDHKKINFDTKFADEEIIVKMDEVKLLSTTNDLEYFDSKGKLWIGKLRFGTDDSTHFYIITSDTTVTFSKKKLFEIEKHSDKFKDHLEISADIGFNFAEKSKTSNLSLQTKAAYEAKRWNAAMELNIFATTIDTVGTGKGNFGVTLSYMLPRNWLIFATRDRSTNDAQQLKLRTNYLVGIGKYLYRSGKTDLLIDSGLSSNKEKFTVSETVYRSVEYYASLNYDTEFLKDLNFQTAYTIMPSLTESKRYRNYFVVNLKYKLTKHLKTKLGYTFNYDTNPPVNSTKDDYQLLFTLGWEL